MEDPVQKKMEEYNESLLKNAVITFNSEAISKELKDTIRKKMSYNKTCLVHLTKIFESIVGLGTKDIKDKFLNKGDIIDRLFEHVYTEMKVTDACLNNVMQALIQQQITLESRKQP